MFTVTSFQTDYLVASSGVIGINPDWRESLEWMNIHTPETGVGYNTIYDKDNFIYPNQSYGVMSWWDYGHMITYIAKRIPNANPFQSGVAVPMDSRLFYGNIGEYGKRYHEKSRYMSYYHRYRY